MFQGRVGLATRRCFSSAWGVAFESARAAIKRPGDLSDEMIAKKIIELANAGERDVEVLGEAALNAPTGVVSAPNPPGSSS